MSLPIVLLTDFGLSDGYVGAMEGVILRIAPSSRIIHLSHLVAPQNIRSAGYLLLAHYKYFPGKTVFLAVIDPGVGTNRKILLAKTPNHYFIAPDNGLLDFVLADVREFSLYKANLQEFSLQKILPDFLVSNTFHGRDLFAPLAAFTALNPNLVLTKSKKIVAPKLALPWLSYKKGQKKYSLKLLHTDRFGNMIYNLRFSKVPHSVSLQISYENRELSLPFVPSFGYVEKGKPLAYVGSSNFLEIAVNQGNAKQELVLPPEIQITFQ